MVGVGGWERSLRQSSAAAGDLLEAATEIGSVSAARESQLRLQRRWGAVAAPTHSPPVARNSPEPTWPFACPRESFGTAAGVPLWSFFSCGGGGFSNLKFLVGCLEEAPRDLAGGGSRKPPGEPTC